jgi:membrane protease YdiL (CAAX protease family)
MYIEQVRNSTNSFWLYIIGVFILGVVIIIGNIPFGFLILAEAGVDAAQLTLAEQMKVLPSNTTLFLLLLPFALVFGAILLITKLLHKLKLRELITSRSKVDWKRVRFGFGTVALSFIAMLVVGYFIDPESVQWNFKPKSFALLVLISVIMVPLQTSAEELFFRGYLMQGLGRIFPMRLLPFVITSTLFGLLHFANPEVDKLGDIILITYLSTGFFLGAITLIDEGLELALGFHAGNNLFLSLFLTSDWTVFQTDSLFINMSEPNVAAYIIGPLIIYSVLFLVYAKKYKWKNYATHLVGSSKV